MAQDHQDVDFMFTVPLQFTYNKMICRLLNIDTVGSKLTFEMIIPKCSPSQCFRLCETVPKDFYFKYLVAVFYRYSCTNVQTRVSLDHVTNTSHFYVICDAVLSTRLVETYTNEDSQLFTQELFPTYRTVYTGTTVLVMHDVTERHSTNKQSATFRGTLTCTVTSPFNANPIERYTVPYGISIQVACTNYDEIIAKIPGYDMTKHKMIFLKIHEAIESAMEAITHVLAPDDLIHAEFNHMLAKMPYPSSLHDVLNIKDIVTIKSLNEIEIAAMSIDQIIFRVPHLEEMVKLKNLESVEHTVGQILSAAYTYMGQLYIPDVIDHEIIYVNQVMHLRYLCRPIFATFLGNAYNYPYAEATDTYINGPRALYWISSPRNQDVEMIFPIGAIAEQYADAIAFGRFNRLRVNIHNIKSCSDLRIRVLAYTDQWTYFALFDPIVADLVEEGADALSPYIRSPFLMTSYQYGDATTATDIFLFIMKSIMESESIGDFARSIQASPDLMKAKGNLSFAEFTLMKWEQSVQLPIRAWLYPAYLEAKEKYFEGHPRPETPKNPEETSVKKDTDTSFKSKIQGLFNR